MSTAREREWLAEWEEERDGRKAEMRARVERYRREPAFLVLDALGGSSQRTFLVLYLILKCVYHDRDEWSFAEEAGQPLKVFSCATRAYRYAASQPASSEGNEATSLWRQLPCVHQIIKLPLNTGEHELGERGGTSRLHGISKVHVAFRGWPHGDYLPLAAFLNRDDAERFQEQCVQVYQAKANPFCGPLEQSTTMPEEMFRDWLLDLGLEPPYPTLDKWHEQRRWSAWWQAYRPALSEWQCTRIGQVMDRIAPYQVLELDCE